MSNRSDRELVTSAQSGDDGALDELLRRHYPRIRAVCRRVIGRAGDADDATQEALIRIVRYLDRFDQRAAFSTWAYRIATNTAIDELRKRQRRPRLQRVDDDQHTEEPTDELAHRKVESTVDRLVLDAALDDLADDYRVAVVMRDVAGLDYATIAAETGVPIGTVKSRVARGRRALIDLLGIGNQAPSTERPTYNPPHEP